jgi:hypothetical protein
MDVYCISIDRVWVTTKLQAANQVIRPLIHTKLRSRVRMMIVTKTALTERLHLNNNTVNEHSNQNRRNQQWKVMVSQGQGHRLAFVLESTINQGHYQNKMCKL